MIRRRPSARSICCTVARETPARAASADCESPSASRIARTQPDFGSATAAMRGNARDDAASSVRWTNGPRRGIGFLEGFLRANSDLISDAYIHHTAVQAQAVNGDARNWLGKALASAVESPAAAIVNACKAHWRASITTSIAAQFYRNLAA